MNPTLATDKDLRSKTNAALLNKTEGFICNLYGRWLDEKEYEDFKDYEKAMSRVVLENAPVGTTFIKGTKRPFGCVVQIQGMPYKTQIYVGAKAVGWKGVR